MTPRPGFAFAILLVFTAGAASFAVFTPASPRCMRITMNA